MFSQIEDRLARLRGAAKHKSLEERAELILEEARAVGHAIAASSNGDIEIELHGIHVIGVSPYTAALRWWLADVKRAEGHEVVA